MGPPPTTSFGVLSYAQDRTRATPDDITLARARRLARERTEAFRQPPSNPTPPIREEQEFDKEYIQGQMRDLLPMLKECYDMALEIDPTLAGKIVVDFNIVGEPDVGGLVRVRYALTFRTAD